MLKRILLTLLTLLIVACMVVSVIATVGALVLLQSNFDSGQSFTQDTHHASVVNEMGNLQTFGSVLDGIGYSSN